jgi:hypothetical protein
MVNYLKPETREAGPRYRLALTDGTSIARSGARIASDAVASPQRHVQHVRDDLAPEAVRGLLEQGEALARAVYGGRDQPSPCRELLDQWRRDIGAGRGDADPVVGGVLG